MAEAKKIGDISTVKDLLQLLGKMRKKGGSNAQPTKNSEGKQMTTTISKELGHPDLNWRVTHVIRTYILNP